MIPPQGGPIPPLRWKVSNGGTIPPLGWTAINGGKKLHPQKTSSVQQMYSSMGHPWAMENRQLPPMRWNFSTSAMGGINTTVRNRCIFPP